MRKPVEDKFFTPERKARRLPAGLRGQDPRRSRGVRSRGGPRGWSGGAQGRHRPQDQRQPLGAHLLHRDDPTHPARPAGRLRAHVRRPQSAARSGAPPSSTTRCSWACPTRLREAGWKVSVSIWTGGPAPEIVRVAPGRVERSIGLAVDVGTTSVAAYLCDLATGEVISYDSMMNPQVPYGEDVMSRITYAMSNDDGIHKLKAAIIEGVNTLAARVCRGRGLHPRGYPGTGHRLQHRHAPLLPGHLPGAPGSGSLRARPAPLHQHQGPRLGLEVRPGRERLRAPERGRLRGRRQRGRAHRRGAVEPRTTAS